MTEASPPTADEFAEAMRVLARALYDGVEHGRHEPDDFADLARQDQVLYLRLAAKGISALQDAGHFTSTLEVAEPDTRIDDLLERVDQLLALARGDHGVIQ